MYALSRRPLSVQVDRCVGLDFLTNWVHSQYLADFDETHMGGHTVLKGVYTQAIS